MPREEENSLILAKFSPLRERERKCTKIEHTQETGTKGFSLMLELMDEFGLMQLQFNNYRVFNSLGGSGSSVSATDMLKWPIQ